MKLGAGQPVAETGWGTVEGDMTKRPKERPLRTFSRLLLLDSFIFSWLTSKLPLSVNLLPSNRQDVAS